MSLISALSRLFDAREGRRAPPRIPARPPVLPAGDAESGAETGGGADRRGLAAGIMVMIEYTDAAGAPSSRRVTAHLVDDRVLSGWCHERRAPRSFRMDRIGALVDVITGEVWRRAPEHYFEEMLGRDHAAVAALRPGVTPLAALAGADGAAREEERRVIADYKDAVRPGSAALLAPWAERLYPTVALARAALDDIEALPRAEADAQLALVAEHARRLVESDGVVTDAEAKAFAALTRRRRRKG